MVSAQPECLDVKFKALRMVGFGGGFLSISTILAFVHILELSKSSKRLKKKSSVNQLFFQPNFVSSLMQVFFTWHIY